ncbi:helix-turn-helix domain-containing protein [Nakamurella sp.]|uniref:nSTAND1 domain-containing NTPase n=1 Tax=Nakamurella sp. TaxID=1869182 RepID=UPI0037842E46
MTKGAISGRFAAPEGEDPSAIDGRTELAAALTRLRERSGLSVRDLARRVDSPVATVGGYLSGRHLPTTAQSAVFLRMLAACGVTDDADRRAWWEAVARVRRAGAARPASAVPPYRGLESFQVQDAALFFGRERLTADLLARVNAIGGAGGRMVAVVGPSGSGKSSLARAGLIPAWSASDGAAERHHADMPADRGGPRSGEPSAFVITPGDRPLRRLAEVLAAGPGSGPTGAEAVERALRAEAPVAAGWLASGLLVVDQFEEVFSSCPDEHERRIFIAALCGLAGVGGPPAPGARVVIVIRADFYAPAIGETALLPVLAQAQVVVGPMTTDEVRRAVLEPARIAGCEVDGELVEVLLRDLSPRGAPSGALDAAALPLLSHALSVTWQRATRRRLTVADYLATGGVAGAVAQSAEAVLAAMPARQQELTARMFLRMINVDDEAAVTRRRMPLAELPGLNLLAGAGPTDEAGGNDPAGTGGVEPNRDAQDVVDRFVAARLMTIDAESVQISHEALLGAWPRLQGWIDESRVALGAQRRLGEAIRVWHDSGRDASALLGSTRLAAMQESLDAGSIVLTTGEAEFLAASAAAVAEQRAARVRGTRRRRVIVAAITALAVLASGLAVFAVVSRRAAAVQQQAAADLRNLAMAGDLATAAANTVRSQDPNVAAQLTIVSYRMAPTLQGRSELLNATAQPLVTRVLGAKGPTMQALSPDGRLLAVADGSAGSVRLMSIADPLHPTVLGTAVPAARTQQFSVAFSPDGRILAAGSSKGVVQLWDVTDPARPEPLGEPITRFPSGVFGVVFTPDGQTLLAGGEGGTIARWSIADPARPAELPGLPTIGLVQTMSLSPDGSLLAVGGRDPNVQLWSLAGPDGPTQVAAVPGGQLVVTSAAFGPDGTTLAVGARDGAVTVWNVGDPAAPVRIEAGLTPFTNLVNVLAFSADGSLLAAGGSDGTVRAWRTTDWVPVGQMAHPGPVTGLAVTADGSRLISSAADGTTRLWLTAGTAIRELPDTVFSLGWTPDGRNLAVAPGPAANAISLWDVAGSPNPVKESTAAPTDPTQRYGGGVAISPDGRTMAATLSDGGTQLWDIADPDHPVPIGTPLTGPTDIVQQVTFSADGRHLAVAVNDASVWLWNVADPAVPVPEATLPDLGGPVYSVAFGDGDRILAAATTAGQAKVWTLDDPSHPVLASTIDAGQSYSFAVTVSPDGRELAVAGADREVRRWDIHDPANPAEISRPLTGPGSDLYWVDYSPDGRLLAAAGTDHSVWLWDVSDPANPQTYATLGKSDGPLFVAEFNPTGSTIAAGGSDHSVHQWLTDPAAAQDMICATVGAPLTEQEWQVYLPDEPYAPPCT